MWTMSILESVERPKAFHVFIGAVKIAEVTFNARASKWTTNLRLMRNDVSYELKEFESMSDALKELHRLLNSPPPEKGYVPK